MGITITTSYQCKINNRKENYIIVKGPYSICFMDQDKRVLLETFYVKIKGLYTAFWKAMHYKKHTLCQGKRALSEML